MIEVVDLEIGETVYTVCFEIDGDGCVSLYEITADDDALPITDAVRSMLAGEVLEMRENNWRMDRAEAAAWRRANSFSGREP